MAFRSNIGAQVRGFYFAASGNDSFSGQSFETPKSTMQAAVDAASNLDPPPSNVATANVTAAQGGSFSNGFTMSEFVSLTGTDVAIINGDNPTITMASNVGLEITTLVNFTNATAVEINGNSLLGFTCGFLGTSGIGVNITGAVSDIFCSTSRVRIQADNAIGYKITSTQPDSPIDINCNTVGFEANNTIFVDHDTVLATDTTVVNVSSITKNGSTGTTAFNVQAGRLIVQDCGSIDVDTAIHVHDGASLDISAEVVVGDIIVDLGGTLNVRILEHTGTLTNNGTINGLISGEKFGNHRTTVVWRDVWEDTSTYVEFDMVQDAGWLMVANTTTEDRAAPIDVGPNEFFNEEVPPWTTPSNNSIVQSGARYVFTEGGYITGIRVWAPGTGSGITYALNIIDQTDPGNLLVDVIPLPVLFSDQWTQVSTNQSIVLPGRDLVIVLRSLNSPSNTQVTGPWLFKGASNGASPGDGEWFRNNASSRIRIGNLDSNSVNRKANLLSINAGSTITFVNQADANEFDVYDTTEPPTDEGSYVQYNNVVLSDKQGNLQDGDDTNMTADIPITAVTEYVEESGFWNTQPDYATVTGALIYDFVIQGGNDLNGFGVDIKFQKAEISPDWDFASNAGIASGGGNADIPTSHAVLSGFSLLDQNPAGVDMPLQIEYGAAQGTVDDPVMIDAAGAITINESGTYTLFYTIQYGRVASGGVSYMFFRALIDGVQVGRSIFVQLDGSSDDVPAQFTNSNIALTAGQVITTEMVRDSQGNDSGGLLSQTPTLAWAPSASAQVRVVRES